MCPNWNVQYALSDSTICWFGFLLFILFQFHAGKQVLNMFNYKP